ncbi:MAG: hypothetical protein QXZ70_03790 [Candidatus Bathyarchaeia archaeon]
MISKKEKEVLRCLLKRKQCNLWEISRFTHLHYSTVFKIIKEQMRGNQWFFITKKRPHKKNKAQAVLIYSLSNEGINVLIRRFLHSELIHEKSSCLKEIEEIFGDILRNYPSFVPEIFRELPKEYSACFYPFFHHGLGDAFLKLLEAKFKEPEKTKFLVDNSFFQFTIPLTEKELGLLLPFVKREISENEKSIIKALKDIEEKRKLIEKLEFCVSL